MTYIQAGSVAATHGLSGEIIIKHILGKKSSFSKVQALFIELNTGSYIPHFISYAKAKSNDESLVKLEDILTKESAARFLKKRIWLTAADFEKQELGTIERVIKQPHKILLQVTINEKEVLLPMHAETLEKIDYKHKQVRMLLPEGLLEVYLTN